MPKKHTQIKSVLKLPIPVLGGIVLLFACLLCAEYKALTLISEDAYASLLRSQAGKAAEHLENYFQKLLSHMAATSLSNPTVGLLETDFAVDVVGMQLFDSEGNLTGTWSPKAQTPTLWPENIPPEQLRQLQQGIPLITKHLGKKSQPLICVYIPVLRQEELYAVSALIDPEAIAWKCFPNPDDSTFTGFAIYDSPETAVAEISRPDVAGHLRYGLLSTAKSLPSLSNSELCRYAKHGNKTYLVVMTPALLPGNISWFTAGSIASELTKQIPGQVWRKLFLHHVFGLAVLFALTMLCRSKKVSNITAEAR